MPIRVLTIRTWFTCVATIGTVTTQRAEDIMRTGWKILGGTSVAGIWAAAIIIGQSGIVQGDTTDSAASSSAAQVLEAHDPSLPYPLGPGAIDFQKLSTADKAAVEQVQEVTETSQPASSYQAWAAATASTSGRADAELAARGIGLVGTEEDGVVP